LPEKFLRYMITSMNGLGERVRHLRAHRAQGAIAKAAGVQQALVSQIEKGRVLNPKIDTLCALARGLGVSLAELVDPDNAIERRTGKHDSR
jgi:transcriptional regulator with XRE-family HTH domain